MKTLSHAEFKAEMFTDEHGPLVTLTQSDGYAEPMEVTMHPWQLKTVLEQFGVVAADKDAGKAIATLERRLVQLRERIETLHDYLCNNSDHKHADLTWEVVYATATLDIANEFCHDLDTPANSAPLQPLHPTPATVALSECSPVPSEGARKQQTIDF